MNRELTIQLYQAINDSDQPREIEHWHASSIAKCPRALYFERKQIPPLPLNQPGAGKKLRWRAGHAIEAMIRPQLQTIYPELITNVRFTNAALDLTGEFDGYDLESQTLISVKSVHDFAMITKDGITGLKERTGTNARGYASYKLKDGPYLHHAWQEHAYITLLQAPDTLQLIEDDEMAVAINQDGTPVYPVEQITYVYITLSGLIACYTAPVDPELLERVKAKVDYLNQCWKDSKLPVCLCREGQEMYLETNQYCSYKTDKDCCNEVLGANQT